MYHYILELLILPVVVTGMWFYLLLLHGGFWRARPRVELERDADAGLVRHPVVAAVVPARNEAESIDSCLKSLLAQDYPGTLQVILVDDGSEDGTAEMARQAVRAMNADERLEVIRGAPLPRGWTGKLWAVAQGVQKAETRAPDYLWLTDADIAHDASELHRLVAIAETQDRDLVSLMVRLRCESIWERLLIPAFVFFFQMLYPFPWANDETKRTAAAAGGSMLVRRTALRSAGGIEAIKGAVIDDCTLARNVKTRGKIWRGLTAHTSSLRRYETLSEIWNMVVRSAYTQLGYSPPLLALCVAGLVVVFALPAATAVHGAIAGNAGEFALGAGALAMMAGAYLPTLRLYGRSPVNAAFLPLAALLYCAMTVDSAWRHHRGKGGGWKGRSYGPAHRAAADNG